MYYSRLSGVLVILLCGGDKSTQAADIALAAKLAKLL
jgi:putative addiction module killer protein